VGELLPKGELVFFDVIHRTGTMFCDIGRIGCGMGENALYFASLGHEVTEADITHPLPSLEWMGCGRYSRI
jgi:hypothetical protein